MPPPVSAISIVTAVGVVAARIAIRPCPWCAAIASPALVSRLTNTRASSAGCPATGGRSGGSASATSARPASRGPAQRIAWAISGASSTASGGGRLGWAAVRTVRITSATWLTPVTHASMAGVASAR